MANTKAADTTLKAMRLALETFYHAHRRDLPWRRSRDPYAIWVSEIMLQQTQVDTVVPRYLLFLDTFPTVDALAQAPEEQVCEAWAGLGYYRRARHMHAAARQIVAHYQGQLPSDPKLLKRLPGMGPYTAGAVASIAYGVAASAVDGNVKRVLARLFCLGDRLESGPGHKAVEALATALAQGPYPGDTNQALMELGALVCTPQAPRCGICPVRRWCQAFQSQAVHLYPRPKPRPLRQVLPMALAWVQTSEGLWLTRRGLTGLWAGLWELPSASGPDAESQLAQRWSLRLGSRLGSIRHELTHRRVRAVIFSFHKPDCWQSQENLKPYADPLGAPLSALARKAIAWGQQDPQTSAI